MLLHCEDLFTYLYMIYHLSYVVSRKVEEIKVLYYLIPLFSQELHHRTYSLLLNDIVNYVKSFYGDNETDVERIIPSATLLTGVNQPDHISQFMALIAKIR